MEKGIIIKKMKHLDNYKSLVIETKILNERLNTIKTYEKNIQIEKKVITNTIRKNKDVIKRIEENLCELEDIETRLYYEIVINGVGISKAVEKIAEEENKDISTIWKNYYPKVKKKIDTTYIINEK